jgi:GTP pyrophosphokinase
MLTSRFENALVYSYKLHKDQTRKYLAVPYFAHLMGVTSMVLEAGGDEDTAIAALLHDAVEDGGGLPVLEEIRRQFGDRVGDIVDQCTDAYTYPKPPWRERKEQYITKMDQATPEARLVSAADKLYNVRTIIGAYKLLGEEVWGLFNGGKEGTLWYYRTMLGIFLHKGVDPLIEIYAEAVDEMEHMVG